MVGRGGWQERLRVVSGEWVTAGINVRALSATAELPASPRSGASARSRAKLQACSGEGEMATKRAARAPNKRLARRVAEPLPVPCLSDRFFGT